MYEVTKNEGKHRSARTERLGLRHGPPDGLRAWADWAIDVHKRWHEGDPPMKPAWRVVGVGGWLIVLAGIVEKIAGG